MSRKAVILSGGLGMRLRPFTQVIPKPLLPIGEKAVLEIQIEQLKKYGFDEIYLATNYKSEYIENFFGDGSRYGVKLIISKEKEPLGTAGPIKLIENELKDAPFLLMNGDVISLIDYGKFYDFALNNEADLTVSVKKIVTAYEFGNIFFEGDRVTHIEEKKDIVTYALAGIYILKKGIFDLIPQGEYFGMDKLILKMLEMQLPIYKYEIDDYWLDIGRIDDYEKVNDSFKKVYKAGDTE
ncbi:NTP transferase domain-containing protein [Christensenellaceae bacterium OttesenSCG-928-K19]|nr:NTP transferase domain-containing protein [Christensenellaceae bacterium OttesenSCG-928-K19]